MTGADWVTTAFDECGRRTTSPTHLIPSVAGYCFGFARDQFLFRQHGSQIAAVEEGRAEIAALNVVVQQCDSQTGVMALVTRPDTDSPLFAGVNCYSYMTALEWLESYYPAIYAVIPNVFFDADVFTQIEVEDGHDWYVRFTHELTGRGFNFHCDVPYPSRDELWLGLGMNVRWEFITFLRDAVDDKFMNWMIAVEKSLKDERKG